MELENGYLAELSPKNAIKHIDMHTLHLSSNCCFMKTKGLFEHLNANQMPETGYLDRYLTIDYVTGDVWSF